MKYLILSIAAGVLLSFAYAASSDPPMTATDQKVVNAINGLKGNLSEGIPEFGIPPLDPLSLPNISINIDQPKLRLNLNLGNTQILDLMSFNITYLHINVLYLTGTFNVYIPSIETNGYYDIDGLLLHLLPVWGSGPFDVKIGDITANGSISIVIKNDHINVTSLGLDLYFQTLQTDFQGLLGNDELASQLEDLIDNLIPLKWSELEPEIMGKIVPIAQEVINDVLQKVTVEQIMGILGLSYVSEPESIISEDSIPHLPSAPKHLEESSELIAAQVLAEGNMNHFVDELLAYVRLYMENHDFDPTALPSDGDSFSMQILGIFINGSLAVENGYLGGLSTIHRTGDCTLKLPNPHTAEASVNIGLSGVTIAYTVIPGLYSIDIPIPVILTAASVDLYLDLEVGLVNREITLAGFNVSQLGSLTLTTGLIPFVDNIVDALGSTVLNFVRPIISQKLTEILEPIIQDVIDKINASEELFESLQQFARYKQMYN